MSRTDLARPEGATPFRSLMLTVLRRELLGWLRRPASMVWASMLHIGLLLFVVAIWPTQSAETNPAYIARLTIYDWFEKLLLLLLLVTPIATATSFANEHEGSTLALLRLTRLRPIQIVLGKLFAAVGYMLILLLSTLPYLVILLGMGGASLKSIGVLYLLMTTTIMYSGLIGQLVSLVVRGRVRAVMTAVALVFIMNMVLPSVQLSMQMYGRVRRGEMSVADMANVETELLYSTPQLDVLHYYVIDLLSPYSVYLNFRHVQLWDVAPDPFGLRDREPAGDFRMVYEHWCLLALLLPLLAFACAQRLDQLKPRVATSASRARDLLWGRLPTAPGAVAFLWSLLIAYAFAIFFNALMERAEPPRLLTAFAMIAIPLFVGTEAADAVARERDRGTLRLHVLTGMSARTFLSRTLRPTFELTALTLLGYSIGLLLPRLPGLRPAGIEVISDDRIAVSILCIVAMSLLVGAIGLLLSTISRSTLGARVGVILSVLFLYVHWKAAAPFDTSAFGVIAASDYNVVLKIIFEVVAWIKLLIATTTHFVNPFVLLSYYFGIPNPMAPELDVLESDLMMTSFFMTPVLVLGVAAGMAALAHRRLVRKHHFLP